jgi:hypothetical protein
MNRHFALPNAAAEKRFLRKEAEGLWLPRGWIDGLTLSNDTTDATNDVVIAPGVCRSTVRLVDGVPSTLARDQVDIEIPVSIIKQLDVAWAPENYDPQGYSGGGRSGGRSASSLTDTTWHAYAIDCPGQQPDIMFHDSATQSSVLSALPSGYTAYRRIGPLLRSTSIRAFTQYGDEFLLASPVLDVNASNPGTSAVTAALTCPTGIAVKAIINASLFGTTSSTQIAYLSALSATDLAPSFTVAPLGQVSTVISVNNLLTDSSQMEIWTNTSAQIRYRLSASAAADGIRIATCGWIDQRGRG